jgi:hypothetical protein
MLPLPTALPLHLTAGLGSIGEPWDTVGRGKGISQVRLQEGTIEPIILQNSLSITWQVESIWQNTSPGAKLLLEDSKPIEELERKLLLESAELLLDGAELDEGLELLLAGQL